MMQHLKALRANKWRDVPSDPGVYWWYFPTGSLERFRIAEFCEVTALNLRRSAEGKICLYHGRAKNLSERVQWHAAQRLTFGALSSGFLSTFRLTLLALNDFDFRSGECEINSFMDDLDLHWQAFPTVTEAAAAEAGELASGAHYPLNIQNNHQVALANFTRHLKAARQSYKRRYLAKVDHD